MRKCRIPFALADSIYEVDVSFYHALGVKVILCDLDNTLVPYGVPEPDEKCFAWKKKLDEEGIRLYLVSNNSGKRVKRFATALGCSYACWMRKPFSGPLKKLLEEQRIDPKEAMLVGDQIMTDITAGNGAGVKTLLTEPLAFHEPPWTKWNRMFDKPKRRKIKKKGLSKPWREVL